MKYNSDFKFDLKIGQLKEQEIGAIFNNKKIEVKTDFMAHETGNIALEYESRGKPSGIAITEADYYAYCLPFANFQNIIIFMEINELKRLAREYWSKGNIKKMGDENTSVSVLIPLQKLFENRT